MPSVKGICLLVLACLAYAAYGKEAAAHVSNADNKVNALSALATLLLTSGSAPAFNPSATPRSSLAKSISAKPSMVAREVMAPNGHTPHNTSASATQSRARRASRAANMIAVADHTKEATFTSHPFHEEWITNDAADYDPTTGLSRGLTVICLEDAVTEDERHAIVAASVPAAEEYSANRPQAPGKVTELLAYALSDEDKNVDPYAFDNMWRMAVNMGLTDFGETASEGKGLVRLKGDDIPSTADKLMREVILPRILKIIDARFPEMVKNLFDGATSLLHLYSTTLEGESLPFSSGNQERNSQLEFAFQEPGINVYTAGGKFKPHEDKQALTVLVPLSDDDAFEKGGTAFWIHGQDPEETEANLKVRPPAGTAMLWVGNVTHAGVGITSGERVVLVASFKRRLTKRVQIVDDAIEQEYNMRSFGESSPSDEK